MLIKIENNIAFKKANKFSWEENTSFWLSHQLMEKNVQEFISSKVLSMIDSSKHDNLLIDLGCGSGWLLNSIVGKTTCKYLGIDNNYKFIDHLQKKYKARADFRNLDIEESFPSELTNKGDVVIN